MKKRWLIRWIISAILLLSSAGGASAAAPSDCDAVEGTGELQFCALEAKYETDALVLTGLFINVSDRTVSGVERLKVRVTGADNAVLSEGEWVDDETLLALSLKPGQTEKVELPLTGAVREADLKAVNTSSELVFTVEGEPSAKESITLYMDGKRLQPEVEPFLQDGSTLVPLRVIFEALGMAVGWDQATQTVTAADSRRVLTLKVGEKKLRLSGQEIGLSVPAQVVNGTTFVPLRAVAEALDSAVFYGKFEGAAQIVIVGKR